MRDKAILTVVVLLAIIVVCGVAYIPFRLHKNALERMVGHPVSNWDAYWTK